MYNKKSSLNLSINAIVILILAITMLGLGLTFMRGVFKQATSKVEAAVSAQDLVNPPTIDNPLTAAPAEITLRKEKQNKITAAFLNTGGSRDCQLSESNAVGAITTGVEGAKTKLTLNSAPASMSTDQINTWTIGITAGTDEGTGVYTLTMNCAGDAYTKDIVITVTS